jgi:flagellar hook-associated protein 2
MDILGSLNKNGSGLNITELAETLANAEIAPRKSLVQNRIDTAELRLSGYDRLRGQLETLNDAIGLMRNLQPRALRSDSSAVAVALRDPAALDMAAASITVDRLASAQVLSFRGFASATAPLAGGALTIETGAWDDGNPPQFTANGAARTLEFPPNSSLTQIAARLDALPGLSARVVDLGDGSFALGVIAEPGRANALRFTAPDGSGMQMFDFSADPGSVQVQAGENAALKLNGIALTRPTNQIDDLLPGVSLTLRATTAQPAQISVNADVEGTLTVMQGFVDMINVTRRLVSDLTGRGPLATAGSDTPLPGDPVAQDMMRGIASILARGFGPDARHLAQMGILTERDGSLSFDTATFTRALERDPAMLDPLLRASLQSPTISTQGLPPASTPAGDYVFRRDPATGATTLNGVPLFGNQTVDGKWHYRVATGPLRGVTLTVAAETERAVVTYHPSLLNVMQDFLTTNMGRNGALADREQTLQRSIGTENIALERLGTRSEELRARYMARFTQMEQVVSQLNSTADYLTNLVDAWNAKR